MRAGARLIPGRLPKRERIAADDASPIDRGPALTVRRDASPAFHDLAPQYLCQAHRRPERDVVHAVLDLRDAVLLDARQGGQFGPHYVRLDPRVAAMQPVAATRVAVQEPRISFHFGRATW